MSHFRDAPYDARLLEPKDVLGKEMGRVDERVAALMGALSNSTRIRALFALLEAGELPVGELAKAVRMSESATSHQLRVLRDLGLVARRREWGGAQELLLPGRRPPGSALERISIPCGPYPVVH